jgi:hypothetical protein
MGLAVLPCCMLLLFSAGLAMWIIPLQLQWLRSWRLFLLCTALLNAACGLFFLWLPESPKYLASRGRDKDAVKVLGEIFAANTGLPAENYPVRVLGRVVRGEA